MMATTSQVGLPFNLCSKWPKKHLDTQDVFKMYNLYLIISNSLAFANTESFAFQPLLYKCHVALMDCYIEIYTFTWLKCSNMY